MKMMGERNENNATDARPDYSVDAPMTGITMKYVRSQFLRFFHDIGGSLAFTFVCMI